MVSAMLSVSPRHNKLSHIVFLACCAGVLLLCQFSKVSADLEHVCHHYYNDDQGTGACGGRLATQIVFVCNYALSYARDLVKRSYPTDVDKNMRDIMLNKKDAFSYLAKRSGQQGILCECCHNPCTFAELIQYCEIPYSRRIRSENYKSKNV